MRISIGLSQVHQRQRRAMLLWRLG